MPSLWGTQWGHMMTGICVIQGGRKRLKPDGFHRFHRLRSQGTMEAVDWKPVMGHLDSLTAPPFPTETLASSCEAVTCAGGNLSGCCPPCVKHCGDAGRRFLPQAFLESLPKCFAQDEAQSLICPPGQEPCFCYARVGMSGSLRCKD